MRGIVFRVAVAACGFAMCFGAFALGLRQRTLPYCQVARNGEWYDKNTVRVRATLFFASDGMYVFEDCDPLEALGSLVEFENTDEDSGRKYVDEVLVDTRVLKAEAIIEGRFDAHYSPGCWLPKYRIAASKIELVSAVSDYNPEPVGIPRRMKH